jgi:hypothetical protein
MHRTEFKDETEILLFNLPTQRSPEQQCNTSTLDILVGRLLASYRVKLKADCPSWVLDRQENAIADYEEHAL